MAEALKPGERLDDLQYQGLRIIQREDGFRFGTDAVLLADFATLHKGDRAADLGSGTGIIALLLAGRQPTAHLTAIEIQPDMADMARRSAALNGLEERLSVRCMDLREAPQRLGYNGYDVVVCNPPYSRRGTGPESSQDGRAIARHEVYCTAQDVARAAYGLLRYGGRLAMVYPADRIAQILEACTQARMEPKRLRLVHHSAGRPPILLLLEAVREGKQGLVWLPPLVLYDEEGRYTPEVQAIYHMQEASHGG